MFKGFFNRMYNGNPNRPDINLEDMPRNKYEVFFTSLGVRFGDLIKLNLLFIVATLPLLLWTIVSLMALNAGAAEVTQEKMTEYIMSTALTYLFGLIPCLVLAGPPMAGLTFVVRNWAKDEHAWLWSDFKEHTIKNWKQSAAVNLILGLVILLAFYTLQFYAIAIAQTSWLWVMQLIFVVLLGMFILSYMYIFPMLVTYKLKVTQLIRNSLMLSLGRLPFTLLFGVLTVFPVALGVGLMLITPWATLGLLLYYLILGFALTSFILNSYTNATFDRLMKPEDGQPKEEIEDKDLKG